MGTCSPTRSPAHGPRWSRSGAVWPPRKRSKSSPTEARSHAAVDLIGDLSKKYAGLLLAADWITLVPVIQYNWLAPFLEPWIKDKAVLFDITSEDPITGRPS